MQDTIRQDDNNGKARLDDALQNAGQNGLASVIASQKSIRLAKLTDELQIVNGRCEEATNELNQLTLSIEELIKINRGNDKGIHGFIGERAQVHLSNAWSLVNGEGIVSKLIDDNGMSDYIERGIEIQQKAYQSNGFLGLDFVLKHKIKYPQFQGKYQIPKDFYIKYKTMAALTEKEAGRLCLHDWNLWKKIQIVKQEGIIIEPMRLTYDEIQKNRIFDTIEKNRENISEKISEQKNKVISIYQPTIKAFTNVTIASSVGSGLLSGVSKGIEKRFDGQTISTYSIEDFKEVGLATAGGCIKGALRGGAMYVAENFSRVPGDVAGSMATVACETVKAVYKYSEGDCSFRESVLAVEKAAISSTAGVIGARVLGKKCPIPIIGEILGGLVFSLLAEIGFDVMIKASKHENNKLYAA